MADLDDLLASQCGVITVAAAQQALGCAAVRWRVTSGRWQRPLPRVLVAHSGPLGEVERRWVALLHAGPAAALGRETAAAIDGLRGYESHPVHVVVPPGRRVPPAAGIVVRRSRNLTEVDVYANRRPRRTRIERSIIDAASYARNDDRAAAILLAAVQQGVARPEALRRVLERLTCVQRRRFLLDVAIDAAGGSHSLPERDFARLLRHNRLPLPDRQAVRVDSHGRRRYLDADWRQYGITVEIDGGTHREVSSWWGDMDRQNDETFDGRRLLRFPAFVVRAQPGKVAARVEGALRKGGWGG